MWSYGYNGATDSSWWILYALRETMPFSKVRNDFDDSVRMVHSYVIRCKFTFTISCANAQKR